MSVDLDVVMSGRATSDFVIPHAEILLELVKEVVSGDDQSVALASREAFQALGPEGLVDAAGVIGNFQRNVRVADATGIPLDDFLEELSCDFREALGIERFNTVRAQ